MSLDMDTTRRHAVKGAALAAIAAATTPLDSLAQQGSPEPVGADEQAVGTVLMQMAKGFAMRDADMAATVYAKDAEWLNAFGDWVVGREAIHAKLTELFSRESGFDSGENVGEPSGSVRIISNDAAVGWTYQEIANQQVGENEVIPLRKNHSLAVLNRTGGDWLIAAHMFMDENIIE